MRFDMLMLSSLLFLAFLAATALGDNWINWDNPSYDVDEMLTPQEDTKIVMGATPAKYREQQKNNSLLNWTPHHILSEGKPISPKDSRAEAKKTSEEIVSNTTTNTELPLTQIETSIVQGNWQFTLNDSMMREVQMALFQKGADIYGSGKIKEGNSILDVTASGTITNSTLDLNLVSSNPVVQYKLNLSLNDDRAAGEYQATINGKTWTDTWTGTAEGRKIF